MALERELVEQRRLVGRRSPIMAISPVVRRVDQARVIASTGLFQHNLSEAFEPDVPASGLNLVSASRPWPNFR